jgi:hypothetical protein
MKYEIIGAITAVLLMMPLVILGIMDWWIPIAGALATVSLLAFVRYVLVR